MSYSIKPLSCDPVRIKGMSERLIVGHYENNYAGAVKRLHVRSSYAGRPWLSGEMETGR